MSFRIRNKSFSHCSLKMTNRINSVFYSNPFMPYIYVICINACLYLETVLKREDIGFLWDKELEDI